MALTKDTEGNKKLKSTEIAIYVVDYRHTISP
jgi:hypothetical protein